MSGLHSKNRESFLASKKCDSPLLEAYSLLVVIELAAKDYLFRHESSKRWRDRHSIDKLLNDLVPLLPVRRPSQEPLHSLGQQLYTLLTKIRCTDEKTGRPRNVKSYPDLRYLRFDSDFGTKHKESKHLNGIISIAREILDALESSRVDI